MRMPCCQAYRTLRLYEGTLPMISAERLLLRAPLPQQPGEDASSWENYLPAELRQGQGEEDGGRGVWAAEMSGQALKIQVVLYSLYRVLQLVYLVYCFEFMRVLVR